MKQSELRDHLVISQALRWWHHPDLWWCHIPNGEYRELRDAIKLKAMGVEPGVPDFLFFHANTPGVAQFVEYKPANGRLNAAQQRLRERFAEIQVRMEVARGRGEMCAILQRIEAFAPEHSTAAANYIMTTPRVGEGI